jgi:hypothetical protein
MTEQWVNDLRAEPIDTNPRTGFEDELRATLIAEQNGARTSTRSMTTGQKRGWLLGAAAACVVLLFGGLLVFSGGDEALAPSTVPEPTTAITQEPVPTTDVEPSSSTVPDAPAPTVLPVAADVVVTDTQAISLDEWRDPAAMPPLSDDIVAIDRQALPVGWTVSGEDGRLLVYPDAVSASNGYIYTAVVTTDGQTSFDVTLSRDPINSDPCFLPTAGFPGTVGDLTGATAGDAVCGQTDDGNALAVVPADRSDTGSQWTALDVANAMSFVPADEVPHPDLTVLVDDEEPATVDFAGTLTGARWAVTVVPSGTRRTDLYVAGNLLSGMELSQEGLNVGQAIPSIESDLTAVPGYGVVAYGHVAGDAVAVIVTTDDERTASLPTSTVDGRSAFAVPIPDSVDVATLTFVAADASALLVVDVPDIPLGYGGGYLGLTPPR